MWVVDWTVQRGYRWLCAVRLLSRAGTDKQHGELVA